MILNTLKNIAGTERVKNEKPSYTVNETQEASMSELEKALQNADGNVLLMLFCYQALTAYKLELELSGIQDETEKRYHELRLINRLNHQVQQHTQEAVQYMTAEKKDTLAQTEWESIEYILNDDPQYLKGHKILKEKKDPNHPDFIAWKEKNPSAAEHLDSIYQAAFLKKRLTGDEGSWSGYFWNFIPSYFKKAEPDIKIDDLLKEVAPLLRDPLSPTDALKAKELCKLYGGFKDEQYAKAFKDPKGQFGHATNLLSTTAKSLDIEIQKLTTKLHDKTSDLHTVTDIMVNVMKSAFDTLRSTGRNV